LDTVSRARLARNGARGVGGRVWLGFWGGCAGFCGRCAGWAWSCLCLLCPCLMVVWLGGLRRARGLPMLLCATTCALWASVCLGGALRAWCATPRGAGLTATCLSPPMCSALLIALRTSCCSSLAGSGTGARGPRLPPRAGDACLRCCRCWRPLRGGSRRLPARRGGVARGITAVVRGRGARATQLAL